MSINDAIDSISKGSRIRPVSLLVEELCDCLRHLVQQANNTDQAISGIRNIQKVRDADLDHFRLYIGKQFADMSHRIDELDKQFDQRVDALSVRMDNVEVEFEVKEDSCVVFETIRMAIKKAKVRTGIRYIDKGFERELLDILVQDLESLKQS